MLQDACMLAAHLKKIIECKKGMFPLKDLLTKQSAKAAFSIPQQTLGVQRLNCNTNQEITSQEKYIDLNHAKSDAWYRNHVNRWQVPSIERAVVFFWNRFWNCGDSNGPLESQRGKILLV